MASATATASPEPPPRRRLNGRFGRSRLGRTIVILNLLGLVVIIVGSLVLSGYRKWLVEASIDSVRSQASLITALLDNVATNSDDDARLDVYSARALLNGIQDLDPGLLAPSRDAQRIRLFDASGNVKWDSYNIADRVNSAPLPPAQKRGAPLKAAKPPLPAVSSDLVKELSMVRASGKPAAQLRRAENGERVMSVSLPIQRVEAVVGVLTVERSDVDQLVARQRLALLPFILVAVLVTLVSSFILYRLVAEPVLRLANAADRVRLSRSRSISLPRLARRDDELGDLTRALQAMTDALTTRIDAIDRFAADVAHEIKNPLTSIGSALETLDLVSDPAGRARLIGIIGQDVRRLDRLVTDISNASRLDAELSRETPHPVDLSSLIHDIADLYEAGRKGEEAHVVEQGPIAAGIMVSGREGPLGQVVRNLIDNARSFSAPDGEVRVSLSRAGDRAVFSVEDDGPGIPPDNLETVFQRFYTSRPKGARFGANSGLGLSIARQIVEAHGGTISAENRQSATGQVLGARFVVVLPETKS